MKVTAPGLGFRASGAIGKSMVFGDWKGIQYARSYVIPANPRSAAQVETRDALKTLGRIAAVLPPLAMANWANFAQSQPLTPSNALVSLNLPLIRGDANLDQAEWLRDSRGVAVIGLATFTGGVGTITVVPTLVAAPTGWTVQACVAAAVRSLDPSPPATYASTNVLAGEDTTSPYSIALTAGQTGVYRCSVVARLVAPDGTLRYSPALHGTATVT